MAPAVRSRHPTGHDAAPGSAAPGDTGPDDAAPDDAAPDSAVPDSTAPDSTASDSAALDSAVPGRWPPPGTIRDRWTADNLAALPHDGLRYEIIDGTLLVSPAPANRHQWVLVRLYELLRADCPAALRVGVAPFDWRIADDTVVEPDVFVVPTPAHIDDDIATPVLTVEILSPSSITADRMIKFARYADAGVGQYWIVDPGSPDHDPTIEIYNLTDGDYVLHTQSTGQDTVSVTNPIPIALTPADLIR